MPLDLLTVVSGRIRMASLQLLTPCRRECGDKETCQHNHSIPDALVARPVVVRQFELAQRSKYDETGEHPESTRDQAFPSPVPLDKVQSRKSHAHVDGSKDNLGDKGVAKTDGCKDGGSVIEEVVRSRQLLESLDEHAENSAVHHARTGLSHA